MKVERNRPRRAALAVVREMQAGGDYRSLSKKYPLAVVRHHSKDNYPSGLPLRALTDLLLSVVAREGLACLEELHCAEEQDL